MSAYKRRDFLKLSSLSALPLIASAVMPANTFASEKAIPSKDSEAVYFINDGIFYKPEDFINKLQEINTANPIERDSYADGGTIEKLLKKFVEITGKEAAVYLPTGTLANQLAISFLCGNNTKAFVQETSHVYRDEGDAAQTLFNKRLIPLAEGKAHFTLDELKKAIKYHKDGEAFVGEVGAVSIETPVRRCDNQAFPLEEIKKISAYCKEQGYKMHLDGARLHMATAFTNATVKEYARYFDTVYMCLYKYLGATGGAILCGDKVVIDQMHHLIKIHGGGIFTNWPSASIALYHLNTIDEVMEKIKVKSASLFSQFSQLKGFKINQVPNGTNQFNVSIANGIDPVKLNKRLREEHNIIFGQPREDGFVKIKVNPTLLRRDNQQIIDSFKEAISFAKV
ncbi:aminotransferase class I/II-fold pyridoxal phosphate-dependent enzyme [Pedobacter panaciterrae]|jgi:Threonine aldolase|uniref:Aminotransferase class I/II-fold pyridoxal phosphate-dependent enzyme n=1 Tax=Pedobacter panaciterrae TaxID=363849 RepID=A0ABU8NJ87_9SPHI|nr:aminotransferase class I/II-fold pyridoxal phosphate-dependent enzyme [Pedobacter panaciterrae]NQX55926.1 aminotransferase class I/II-fold pyridoxal phosphate-dependent enzyme [Pedobacter panaciterrae]